MLTDHRNALLNLRIGHAVGVAQNNASCVFNLIVEEFTKILHIHLAFVCIYNGSESVQNGVATVFFDSLYRANNVAELTNARGLNQNTIRMIFVQRLFQRRAEITDQTTADATGIHFGHFNTGILHKAAVNADLTKFVFNEH
jgi:hypothetical protein